MESIADGFFRIAAATPRIRVADVAGNAEAVLAAIREAAADGVRALVLPELCLTGYTAADLLHDRALLTACERALARILEETADLPLLFAVGLPVAHADAVYNVAAVCCRGRLLGLTAKRHLPTYGEFYEARWFAPAPVAPISVAVAGQTAPLGSELVYACNEDPDVRIGVEVCEDLWVPDPPSVRMATDGGATVILNLSASDELVGKEAYRRMLVASQSARLFCAYAYADAGEGESTTDLVFAGVNLVAENGAVLCESEAFTCGSAVSDIDLARLVSERRRTTTWTHGDHAAEAPASIPFSLGVTPTRSALETDRVFNPRPFVPEGAAERAQRCETILSIQAAGLATRLVHTSTSSVLIGLSGGLDSTLALLVCARAFDRAGLDRAGIHAVSMPGFGTTSRTKGNAERLADELGVDFREIAIGSAVERHFTDIGHDPAVRDVTYENSQARERTQILMDLANELHGFVVGTGDLSELALGWATYNADHMSMYGVNAGVPKTLVRHLVRYAADTVEGPAAAVLADILDTPVSPELLPPTEDGEIAQRTEDLVGPYELHDYFLYHMIRGGHGPGRIYRQACRTFEGTFEPALILSWLRVFYRRFFSQQFKRSCLPDGPKVGSVTLSPRGDWRMPSDASARLWLAELDGLA
ncbi:NAD(+) synthase [Collinsella vaginalis]|uniref:NAD(+) synthase n=1 Tax=Collinsella vaginalis TaxID=1870987 RepID=UPI000A269473|nr:NAD(+) synthase [Collinsella vaginalis]